MRAGSTGGLTGRTRRWLQAIAAAGATLLSLLIVFAAVAVATTSLAIRMAIGIVLPGLAALFVMFALPERDWRQATGIGIFIGVGAATFITLFLFYVMVLSSGPL